MYKKMRELEKLKNKIQKKIIFILKIPYMVFFNSFKIYKDI